MHVSSTLSLITSPTKISGIRDLIHKYNNFFFDLDGVIVLFYPLSIVARPFCHQGLH
jgi:hypothetical protein